MKKTRRKSFWIFFLFTMILMNVFLGRTSIVSAASTTIRDSQQEDAYTDNGLAAGYAYPVNLTYRLSFFDNLCSGTILVNYVGGNVDNFGLSYQRAAVKFNISAITGTIISATFKIYVKDANSSPVVNLISTTDNSWTQTNQRFPSYNPANIINGYSNSPVALIHGKLLMLKITFKA